MTGTEKRFYLGLGILIFFLVFGFFLHIAFSRIHTPIAEGFDAAVAAVSRGDLELGISLARQAAERWQNYRSVTAAVADHTPMDEIDSLMAEMEVFARFQDGEHFSAVCAQLAHLVRSVYDTHRLIWMNIL